MRARGVPATLTAAALLFAGALAAACQRAPAAPPATAADFERATAGLTRTQTVEYVLDTYKCGTCHTVDAGGNMGFTAKGEKSKELAACCAGSTMCVRLLQAANTLTATAESDRSPDERRMLQAFDEYGCSFCHRVEAGKTSFTGIGSRLGFMHLGCVEVEDALRESR